MRARRRAKRSAGTTRSGVPWPLDAGADGAAAAAPPTAPPAAAAGSSGAAATAGASVGGAMPAATPAALVAVGDQLEGAHDGLAEVRRVQHPRLGAQAEDPRHQLVLVAVRGGVDAGAVGVDRGGAVGAEHLVDPPGDGGGEGDRGRALLALELPRRAIAVAREVEVLRRGEVVLGARPEGDAPLDARQPEDAGVLALVGVADHVPVPRRVEQGVGVNLALGVLVAADRVVGEADRLAAADRRLDLGEVGRDLGAVVAAEQVHRDGAGGVVVERARAAEGEVLQRQPQRLRVGELPLQQVQAGLEGGELGRVEVELRQVVVLRRQRVQVALERVVARALNRQAQAHRLDLGPVGVEAAQEGLLGHAAVALHRLVDLVGGDRSLLRHQKGHQGELADQLVVVSHRHDRVPGVPSWEGSMIAQAPPPGRRSGGGKGARSGEPRRTVTAPPRRRAPGRSAPPSGRGGRRRTAPAPAARARRRGPAPTSSRGPGPPRCRGPRPGRRE